MFVPRIVPRRRTLFLSGEKKGKKVLHRALEKAIFCSSVKLFFDEKVFKETRTNATLTTTLIKKEKKTEMMMMSFYFF